MVKILRGVDAVVIGLGWAGSILARELTKAGLSVVGLERGVRRLQGEDYGLPGRHDELRYAVRHELAQDAAMETVTVRNTRSERALPMRRLGAFTPGDGLGGGGAAWNGYTWRLHPSDHELRSHLRSRYGPKSIPVDMTIQDWGVTYAELEPCYERFERLCGVSGKAGNLRGRRIEGGNVFEGPRAAEYPNPPLAPSMAGALFEEAAKSLGYHPFPTPASNMSRPYTNSEGLLLGACRYCGHCERFGCDVNAKASPNASILPVLLADGRFELRSRAYVSAILYDRPARRARAARYVDMLTGEEYEQPAELVVLTAYTFNNTLLMLLSGIGRSYDAATGVGVIGKNYCYQVMSGVQVFVEDKDIAPFMGAGAIGSVIDDFNGDNFDHAGLGFLGGGAIAASVTNGRPIQSRPVPPGTPRWGSAWKRAVAKWYNHSFFIACHGSNFANRNNYLDLDPTYRDALGRPLVRMTYNFVENDHKMSAHITDIAVKIARAMRATIVGAPAPRTGNFSAVPYQSTHNAGGVIMGGDPRSSAVNRYLQSWDADNLFVIGASAFPQSPGYNPTGAVGALSYWAANAIVTRYLSDPGPLVPM